MTELTKTGHTMIERRTIATRRRAAALRRVVRMLVPALLLIAPPIWAQNSGASTRTAGPAAPEETEILVPDLVLEVEELELQQVSAVLPEEGELALGRVTIPLPGSDELVVEDGAFDVPLPGSVAATQGESVFTSGRLGAGSANHIVGEVSVFKLGSDPRFRLRFSHEGLDGYQFLPAGTGYFVTTNVIDGWFAGGTDVAGMQVEAAFSEEVNGLQGESDFFSTGLRRTTANATVSITPDPLVEVGGTLDAAVSTRIQAASGPSAPAGGSREQEYVITPQADLSVTIASVDLVLDSSYFLRVVPDAASPVSQDVDLHAGLDLRLPASFTASARAGVQWDPARGLAYPWSLRVDGLLGDAVETSLSGGYRIERLTLGEVWDEFPVAASSPAATGAAATGEAATGEAATGGLQSDPQWFGRAGLRWSGPSGLSLAGDAEFTAHGAVVDIEPYDASADAFPFVQRAMLSLVTSTSMSWRPNPQMQVQAGWAGAFIDSVTGVPTNSVDGSVRVSDGDERFSAVAEVRSDFFPQASLPWLGLSGAFALSEEIEFTLELEDLLAPLLTNGRASIGPAVSAEYPFIEPGFRASIFTRISL